MGNCNCQESPQSNHASQEELPNVIWQWQSNNDPWSKTGEPQWSSYSVEQIRLLEETFQKKDRYVDIENYKVDLKENVQINKAESWKVRPIKRVETNMRYLRFSSDLATISTFNRINYAGNPPLIQRWLQKRSFEFKIDQNGYNITSKEHMPELEDIVESACLGILKEAEKGGWNKFAEIIVKRIRDTISKNPKSIFIECIIAYTEENHGGPSLYTVVNKALRENDFEKTKDLAPYCYLLHFASRSLSSQATKFFFDGQTYRGMTIDEKMLELYKAAYKKGLQISFNSFVSTSKKMDVATSFQSLSQTQKKILLIFKNINGIYIEDITSHKGEEEVFLPAGKAFEILDMKEGEITIITLKMIDSELNSLSLLHANELPIIQLFSSFSLIPPNLIEWASKELHIEIDENRNNITPPAHAKTLKEFIKLVCKRLKEIENEIAIRVADDILFTMKNDFKAIFKKILHIYIEELFIFKEMNRALREEDLKGLENIGGYSYLLNACLVATTKRGEIKIEETINLYRAMSLPKAQFEILKELRTKNLHFGFGLFLPTSKRMDVVIQFFNHFLHLGGTDKVVVLFIIRIPKQMALAFDLKEVSLFLNEEEVLIPPSLSFKILAIKAREGGYEVEIEFMDYLL